jgi:pentafunctional AROM polypeptide
MSGKMLELAEGASVVELRVDLLRSWDHNFVRNQSALLRRSCPLPVIYTVRTKSQGGAFPDDENAYFALSRLALRCGCVHHNAT